MTARKKEPEPEPVEEIATHTRPTPPAEPVPEGGQLAEYEITGPDGSVYTALLSDADAQARGAKAITPANKAVTPSDK